MLLLTFAVPHESRHFRRSDACESVQVLHTGIGQAAAAESLRRALDEMHPSVVISSGFAGALEPQLRVGDLVSDTRHSNPDLLSQLPEGIRRGPVYTAANPIGSADEKRELYHTSGAIAVDMESSAIAAECARAGIPLLILRVISDAAGDPIPVPLSIAWNLRMQRPRPIRLATWLLAHPGRIFPFIHFVRGTNLAARRLGEAIPSVINALGIATRCARP